MANVYTREGKKGVQIWYEYKTKDNPRKRVPSGIFLSGTKAHQKLQLADALIEARRLEGEKVITNTITVSQYVSHVDVGIADKTKYSVSTYKKRFLAWCYEQGCHNNPLTSITRKDAEDYLIHLVSTMKVGSAKTYYSWMKVIFNQAVDDDLIPVNPFILGKKRLAKIYSSANQPATSAEALTINQIRQLCKYEDTLIADLTKLIFLCNGRRLNEIFKLKWEDIDYQSRMIKFVTSKTGQVCYVYISDTLMALLQDIRQSHNADTVLPDRVYTLSNKGLTPVSMDLLSRRMHRALYALGIIPSMQGYSGYGCHSIRRTVETLLIEKYDFARADYLVGHAPKSIGARSYYRPTQSLYIDAATYLESLIVND